MFFQVLVYSNPGFTTMKLLSDKMWIGVDLSYSKPYSEYMYTTKKSHCLQIRPWVRFWARMIDYNCLGIVYGIIFNRYVPLVLSPFFTIIVIPLIWIPIESILLWAIGTTLGKWLLKITVRSRQRQKYLTFQQACIRSISVWCIGMGCGVPIIQIITLIIAKIKLNHTGMTTWDKNSHLIVQHNRIGILRIFVIILFFFILISQTTRIFIVWEEIQSWS